VIAAAGLVGFIIGLVTVVLLGKPQSSLYYDRMWHYPSGKSQ
jgi:hypothetical protein